MATGGGTGPPAASIQSPQGQDLVGLARSVTTARGSDRTRIRLGIRASALVYRQNARRWERAAKVADSFAKFGGGSLLTATALLLIGGETGIAVTGIAGLTLLMFIIGTMSSAVFENRADRSELEEEHLVAVLEETEL